MRYPDYNVAPRIKQPAPRAIDRAFHRLAYLTAALPLLLYACLYAGSWRGSSVIGHWPQAPFDPPAAIAARDRCFATLALTARALAGLTLIAPLAVAAGVCCHPAILRGAAGLRARDYWALALIHTASLLMLLFDPGTRLQWLLG